MKSRGNGEKFWSEHLRAWRQSGLSQGQYCARHGVSLASLRYWSTRLNKSRALSLIPVQRIPVGPMLAGCVLRAPNGWVLEFAQGTCAHYLAEVLGALR